MSTDRSTRWWLTYQQSLLALARRLARDEQDAQDLVSETFLRAVKCTQNFETEWKESAWLVTVLRNQFVDGYRRSRRYPTTELKAEGVSTPVQEDEPAAPWGEVSPEDLQACIAQLKPEFRSVYTLFSIHGLSYAEISSKLSIPERTIGTRLSRARGKLKQMLLDRLKDKNKV